jgi:hypothetical protein
LRSSCRDRGGSVAAEHLLLDDSIARAQRSQPHLLDQIRVMPHCGPLSQGHGERRRLRRAHTIGQCNQGRDELDQAPEVAERKRGYQVSPMKKRPSSPIVMPEVRVAAMGAS